MTQRKVKHISLLCGFLAGLTWVGIHRLLLLRHPAPKPQTLAFGPRWASPEQALAALTDENVDVRREAWQSLRLRPGANTVYYDFARDANYPERPDRARLRYVNFDAGPAPEALITFVRLEHPVAIVLRRDAAGWECVGTFSAWLRYEEYPYDDWLETPVTVDVGRHELLLRDSNGDAQSYTRTTRLWRLDGGQFREIAALEEESLTPRPNYHGPDWANMKSHCVSHISFALRSLEVDTSCRMVKLSGTAPAYRYLSETDGVWHTAPGHWRKRTEKAWQTLFSESSRLVWDDKRGEFVKK